MTVIGKILIGKDGEPLWSAGESLSVYKTDIILEESDLVKAAPVEVTPWYPHHTAHCDNALTLKTGPGVRVSEKSWEKFCDEHGDTIQALADSLKKTYAEDPNSAAKGRLGLGASGTLTDGAK